MISSVMATSRNDVALSYSCNYSKLRIILSIILQVVGWLCYLVAIVLMFFKIICIDSTKLVNMARNLFSRKFSLLLIVYVTGPAKIGHVGTNYTLIRNISYTGMACNIFIL